ncbi:hypothetical protein [Nostoc sp. FACHB-110]|uniref:hypothetical protein n=1 Tax=Nostoc sp. FACHB-110 TaxID=2692834 RepID=UPI001683D2FC|nr:hypothetical protein [Nostoc sp. FACHB-110]MBD2441003.1 hypothetical protein [Nostoc sp. FACHB-110]
MKKTTNKYLENLLPDEIDSLKASMNQLNYEVEGDSEDWATELGKLYVSRYGYPSDYDTYFEIGSSLIYYFKKSEEQSK